LGFGWNLALPRVKFPRPGRRRSTAAQTSSASTDQKMGLRWNSALSNVQCFRPGGRRSTAAQTSAATTERKMGLRWNSAFPGAGAVAREGEPPRPPWSHPRSVHRQRARRAKPGLVTRGRDGAAVERRPPNVVLPRQHLRPPKSRMPPADLSRNHAVGARQRRWDLVTRAPSEMVLSLIGRHRMVGKHRLQCSPIPRRN
jgi:hypothetical protein